MIKKMGVTVVNSKFVLTALFAIIFVFGGFFVFTNVAFASEISVATYGELTEALASTTIDVINITVDISGITATVAVERPMTINGNGHTLTLTGLEGAPSIADDGLTLTAPATINDLIIDAGLINPASWFGTYAVHVFNTTATLNNITAKNGNGGILIKNSTVSMTGSINVSNNGFGGIESTGASAVLDVSGATFFNTTEAYGKPTIWEDGTTGTTVTSYGVLTRITKSSQYQFYLTASNGTTINVPANYSTIGAAITAANSGDTINVAAGTYDLGATMVTIDKSLTFTGPNAAISPNGGSRVAEAIIAADNSIGTFNINPVAVTVVFRGFNFQTDGAEMRSDAPGATITLEKNIFTGARADSMYFEDPNLTVDDNLFTNINFVGVTGETIQMGVNTLPRVGTISITNNTWSGITGNGALNSSNQSGTVSGNTFDGVEYYGILVGFNADLTISNNVFNNITNPTVGPVGNELTWGAGIRFYEAGALTAASVTGNTFSNSYLGVSVRATNSDITGANISVTNNSFTGNTASILNAAIGTLNATSNWWGTPIPNFGAIISGSVTYDPWYLDGDKTILSTSIATIFDNVASTLLGQNVVSNISDVTASNYQAFSNLYFEKRTDVNDSATAVGKLAFSNALDLSGDETKTFLQALGNKMEQGNGRIAFDARTSAIFSATGASITMYGLPSGITPSQLIVRSDTGTILNAGDVISGFSQHPMTNAITFTASHFTQFDVDTVAPTTTDNTNSSLHNTNQTITFGCSDSLSGCATTYYTTNGSTPTTNSSSGSSVLLSTDGVYTIKYFSVDASGNTETVKTAANTVNIDKTAPATPVITTPAQTVNTNTITVTGTAEANSTVSISGGASLATGTATGGSYSIIVTLTHNTLNVLSVTARDAYNNTSSAVTVAITHDNTAVSLTSFTAGSATLTSIILGWTNSESNGSFYTIKRSTSPITSENFASATTLGGAPTVASGVQGYNVNNLSSGTTYYFAIRITDAVGNVSSISTTNGTTSSVDAPAPTDDTAPSAISNLLASAGTLPTSQIALSWSAVGDDGVTGLATKYIIVRSANEITSDNFASAITIFNSLSPKSNGSTETFTISNLLANTQYCFAIKTLDENDNSSISNSSCLTTTNNAPTATGVTPATSVNNIENTITITGLNFIDNSNVVRFTNSTDTFDLSAITIEGSLSVVIPIGVPTGVYSIRVTNNTGSSGLLSNAYTVTEPAIPFPTISDVVPSNIGTNDADTLIEIYGENFTGATTAVIDGVNVTLTNLVVVTDTKITATIPGSLVAGTYNVKITTGAGTNAVSTVKLTVQAPVVINTANTQEVTTSQPIDMGNTNTIPVQITMQSDTDTSTLDNNTTIEVVIPPATVVTDGDGNPYTGNINPPQLVKPTEEIVAEAGEDAVVITMGNPNETIEFSNDFVVTVTLESSSATAPLIWYYNPTSGLEIAGKDGVKDGVTYVKGGTVLNTVNNNGTYTHTIGLLLDHMSSYVAGVTPTISGISPSSGLTGSSMVITGTNFSPGAVVKFGATSASVSSNSVTQITVTVPSSINIDSHVITVTNTDNLFATSPTNFTVTVTSPPPSGGGGGGGPSDNFPKVVALVTTAGVPVTVRVPSIAVVSSPALGRVLGVSAFNFSSNLRQGVSSDAVRELQTRLTSEGVYTGPITGYFGSLTLRAVKAYQKGKGLPQTGFVGPMTRGAFNSSGQVLGASTSTEREALIESIRQQIQALLAQIADMQARGVIQ